MPLATTTISSTAQPWRAASAARSSSDSGSPYHDVSATASRIAAIARGDGPKALSFAPSRSSAVAADAPRQLLGRDERRHRRNRGDQRRSGCGRPRVAQLTVVRPECGRRRCECPPCRAPSRRAVAFVRGVRRRCRRASRRRARPARATALQADLRGERGRDPRRQREVGRACSRGRGPCGSTRSSSTTPLHAGRRAAAATVSCSARPASRTVPRSVTTPSRDRTPTLSASRDPSAVSLALTAVDDQPVACSTVGRGAGRRTARAPAAVGVPALQPASSSDARAAPRARAPHRDAAVADQRDGLAGLDARLAPGRPRRSRRRGRAGWCARSAARAAGRRRRRAPPGRTTSSRPGRRTAPPRPWRRSRGAARARRSAPAARRRAIASRIVSALVGFPGSPITGCAADRGQHGRLPRLHPQAVDDHAGRAQAVDRGRDVVARADRRAAGQHHRVGDRAGRRRSRRRSRPPRRARAAGGPPRSPARPGRRRSPSGSSRGPGRCPGVGAGVDQLVAGRDDRDPRAAGRPRPRSGPSVASTESSARADAPAGRQHEVARRAMSSPRGVK